MKTTNEQVTRLREAVEQASRQWTGLDWDSGIDWVADSIRSRKRVDLDQMHIMCDDASAAGQRSDRNLRGFKGRLEDLLDDDTSDELREELAKEAEEYAADELRYVEGEAKEAAEYGARAIRFLEAGDLDEMLASAKQAARIEDAFGDSPAWGPVLALAEELVAAMAEEEDEEQEVSVIAVPQVDGGTRWLALSQEDAAIAKDPSRIDSVQAQACLDVDENGRREWRRPFGCEDTEEGRAAILSALDEES